MRTQTKWIAPKNGGAPLLTMCNIPLPTHGLAPRTIMGATEWGKLRRQCYKDANDHCEICGVQLCGNRSGIFPLHESHEVYSYDFEALTQTFIRPVCLCPACHRFIHSGRAITCYKNHEPLWTADFMLSLAEHGFRLIADWNKQHPDNIIYAYETLNNWLDEPSLAERLWGLMQSYNIEIWCAPKREEWDNAWGKWRLIYDGVEYYSPYQSREEWEDATRGQHPKENKELFAGDEFETLRRNINGNK